MSFLDIDVFRTSYSLTSSDIHASLIIYLYSFGLFCIGDYNRSFTGIDFCPTTLNIIYG